MTLSEATKKADDFYPEIENDSSRFTGWARVVMKDGSEVHLFHAYITFIESYLVLFSLNTRPLVYDMEDISAFSSGESGDFC